MQTITPAAAQRDTPQHLRDRIARLIGGDLREAMQIYDRELASANPVTRDLLEHSARFRGKQLRPSLLLMTAAACGGVRKEHRVLAAVIEMVHVATLLHDDVLDDADIRRHVATVNGRWNNESAVLFGDYLFTHAFHLAASLETTTAARLVGAATNRVCEGELTQVAHRGDLTLDEATYFRIIDGKTAELCAVACSLGAIYAGAADEVVVAAELYGRRLGIAFQIADDLLDLNGDSGETGKTLGTDLQKQKLTLPLIRLLSTASTEDRDRIHQLLRHPNEATRTAIEPFIKQSDAMDYARSTAQKAAAEAKSALQSLPDNEAKRLLLASADAAVDRRR